MKRVVQLRFTKNVNIFIFVNSSSGQGIGSKLLNTKIQKAQFCLSENEQVHNIINATIHFCNLKQNKHKHLKDLKLCIEEDMKTICVVCGGDGTTIWVVKQIISFGIDILKTSLALIPAGTGNDLSRVLGWGAKIDQLTQKQLQNLKGLIIDWAKGQEDYLDMWDITAQVYDNGCFQRVQNGESITLPNKTFQATFCNYFSFGLDGKIGYSFDKYRTKSRFGNFLVYAVMGMAKSLTKTRNINQLVKQMRIIPQQKPINKQPNNSNQHNLSSTNQFNQSKINQAIIFRSNLNQNKDDKGQKILENTYTTLLALNINSFMAGTHNVWQNAKSKVPKSEWKQLSQSDGVLQFIGFGSVMGMGMQKMISGFGSKIHQGKGPFLLQFFHYQNFKNRTYLQIDGQFMRFVSPKTLKIERSKLVKGGRIRVIRKSQH